MSTRWPRIRLWWRALVGRRRFERELDEELEFHRLTRVDELLAAGIAPAEAERRARIELGMTELHRDGCRRARGLTLVDAVSGDLRHGLGSLRRSPGYTTTAVLVLALPTAAILLLAAMFDAYALTDPPIERPRRWVAVEGLSQQLGPIGLWSAAEAEVLLERPPAAFEGLYASRSVRLALDTGSTWSGFGEAVSNNYFELLGIPPLRGRLFAAGSERRDRGGIVLSEKGWQRLFDGRPDVVGQRLRVGGRSFEVIGVAGRGFSGLSSWASLYWIQHGDYRLLQPDEAALAQLTQIGGFLHADAGRAEAAQSLSAMAIAATAEREADARLGAVRVLAQRGHLRPGDLDEALLAAVPAAIAVLALLLVCSANLANLVLARFAARRHELALRAALGASRTRLIGPLLAECVLIAIAASLVAYLTVVLLFGPAHGAVFGLLSEFGIDLIDVSVGWRVWATGLLLSLVAAASFGGLPALLITRPFAGGQRQPDAAALRRANPGRLRGALMVGQIAVSVVLVVVAGLIAANARLQERIPLGFDPARIAAIGVAADGLGERLAQRLRELPEVEAVGAAAFTPLMHRPLQVPALVDGRSEPVMLRWVDPGYFDVLELTLQRGRRLTRGDLPGAAVAVLSRRTAERLWPGHDPLGRLLPLAEPDPARPYGIPARVEVVGVVDDVASGWLLGGVDRSAVYLPIALDAAAAGSLLVRLRHGGPTALDAVQRRCIDVAPQRQCQPLLLESALRLQKVPVLLAGWAASALGWSALAISCIGLYGLVGFLVVQQRREIGVQLALGATAATVVRTLMRRAGRQIGIGLAIGLPLAFAAARAVAALTEHVRTFDLRAFVLEPLLLVAVALLAAWWPARLSTRIPPSEALRSE